MFTKKKHNKDLNKMKGKTKLNPKMVLLFNLTNQDMETKISRLKSEKHGKSIN